MKNIGGKGNQDIMKQLEKISEEEKHQPYAKYIKRKILSPEPYIIEALCNPMDSRKAIMPDNIADMLTPGHLEVENGWCNFEDGGGYICVNTFFKNCTTDMWNWFSDWRTEKCQNIRYRVWYPSVHYVSYCSAQTNHEWMVESVKANGKVFVATGRGVPIEYMGLE